MKDTQSADATSLKQRFSSYPDTDSDLFYNTKRAETDDLEPFRKAPVPSVFQAPQILSSFRPDPLLLVTPEKTLGAALWDREKSASNAFPVRKAQEKSAKEGHVSNDSDDARKGRPRVRFAPGTRTSPSSKDAHTDSTDLRKEGSDSDSVPRSFSVVSQKLYQPGLYADSDDNQSTKIPASSTSAPLSGASAPKRYTVERRGNSTVYVPMDDLTKSMTSEYSERRNQKSVTGKVIRHTPETLFDDGDARMSETRVKEVLRHYSPANSIPRTSSPSPSSSPSRSQRSCRQSSPSASCGRLQPSPSASPSRRRASSSPSPTRRHSSPSPSRSPGHVVPVGGPQFLRSNSDKRAHPNVKVIREAPRRPQLRDYVFPFDSQEGGRQEYDSNFENPLARPEFNSALKISEELKSVKIKRPDTWGAVSQTLKKSDRKRTQIQEKASSKVNVEQQSGLYTGLVDINVPLDDLCNNVERGITLRAPSALPAAPAKTRVGREPDLMEFFSPELQQELPDLTLTGIQPITEHLSTADPIVAFDLYRHNRAWDGLTDS